MKMAKRVFLFVTVNLLIITSLSVVLSLLGIKPYLENSGINFTQLILFCVVWGFGGAFISLALSRTMAKWTMGVRLLDPQGSNLVEAELVAKVHTLSKAAKLPAMPEVGIYESEDVNAFATGPTKSRALVAVSTGLLARMNEKEVEGVLAHEVAHIANGDMVTMTLIQGVVNAFVMFVARVIGYFVSEFVEEEKRPMIQFGVVLGAEILLGMVGMLVVAKFSRSREFRADEGGAQLAGNGAMIAALSALKRVVQPDTVEDQPALATLKISGKSGGLLRLFSTHPDLDERIERLLHSERKASGEFNSIGQTRQYG